MAAERPIFGFSLFCDDFRQELGGKTSLMGIYQADMVLPTNTAFPVVIPKFVILVKYFEFVGACTEDLLLKIYFPGDDKDSPTITQPFRRSDINNIQINDVGDDDSDPLYVITIPLILSPFQIKSEGYISVRMHYGNERVRLGRLQIRNAKENEKLIGVG